jgi:signal peptidase II
MTAGTGITEAPGSLSRRNWLVFCGVAITGLIADLGTKNWIFNQLGMPLQSAPWWLWNEVFGFETSLNEGALFGVGQGQAFFFAGCAVLAGIGVVLWMTYGAVEKDLLLSTAMGCVLAGICGNLYDRLGLPGLRWHLPYRNHQVGDPVYAVRDWLHFKIDALSFDWAIFNIADSLLVCGFGLLVFHSWWKKSDSGIT